MEKIEITKRDLMVLGVLSAAAAVICVVWMALTGNAPQTYKDIVIEWTALVRSNKSAEITLLRLLILLGSAAVFLCPMLFRKRHPLGVTDGGGRRIGEADAFCAWICSVIALKFLFMQQVSPLFALALCVVVIARFVQKDCAALTLCLYFLGYYTVFAAYHACNFLGSYGIVRAFAGMNGRSSALAVVSATLCAGIPLFFTGRRTIQKRLILLCQLALPALFLILSLKEYVYKGETVNVGIPFQAKIFVALSVMLCLADAVRTLKKSWRNDDFSPGGMLSIGSCIAIMCFNVFGGQGAVVSQDMHHPFENIFAFQQIFELGQVPYRDFIPPSGLYSVVHGAFFKFFGNGDVAHYALASNIFLFVIVALVLFLLQFHVDRLWCLAVALFLQFPTYNRTSFIAPIALLLLLPSLVERPGLWLKVFLLVSVFHGLYYPVYGVAVCAGFIPMFVAQARKVITDEKKPHKTARFWIPWAFVLAAMVFSFPLLWGTFVHIRAMAGQSVLADGISIFGQELPGWFMPYARNIVRYPTYNAMRIVPLAFMVWLPVLFLRKIFSGGGARSSISGRIEIVTAALSLALIPLVSYTYSFIRIDMFTLFARSWSALVGVLVLHVVFAAKYVKNSQFRLLALLLLNVLIVPSWGVGVDASERKMFSRFGVPGGYWLVGGMDYPAVGKCFLHDSAAIYREEEKLADINGESSFAKLGSFGYWYIFGQKGGANLEGYIMKGFGAAKETKDMLAKNGVVSGGVDPLTCYYLYNYLVSSGEYVWSAERGLFVPSGGADHEETRRLNLDCPFFRENYDLGNSADVFGLSFKSLRGIFTERRIPFSTRVENGETTIELADFVRGKDMDFVYLEFGGIGDGRMTTEFNMGGEREKKQSRLISRLFLKSKPNPGVHVSVSFYGEDGQRHTVRANYGNGRLLMNLGVGAKWLLERHRKLEVSVMRDGEALETAELKRITFLKCRQIYDDKPA